MMGSPPERRIDTAEDLVRGKGIVLEAASMAVKLSHLDE